MNEIGKDISMGGVVTEEQAISHAQYLDIVYLQTGTFMIYYLSYLVLMLPTLQLLQLPRMQLTV